MQALNYTLLVFLLLGLMVLPRRGALACALIGTLFLTQYDAVQFGEYTFYPNRLLAYVGFLRVAARGEFVFANLNKVDRSLILLYVFTTSVLLTRPEEAPPLRLAKMLDVLLGYMALRGLLATPDDFRWLLRCTAWLLVPYVLLLFREMTSHQNPFSTGIESSKVWLRDDRLRCFGSFRHPSLLGSLGATIFPLFVALFWDKDQRKYAILGGGLCLAVIFFSNSGGPISAFMAGVAAWLLWPIRKRMRQFRWLLLAAMVCLALIMKAPIWFIIMRISGFTGGTGWHRSYLIDVALRHLDRWWLIGLPIAETQSWFHNVIKSTGGADITNQYISFGLSAGVLAIALFILFIVRSYSYLGGALALVRNSEEIDRRDEALLWGLGATLTAHLSNWLGISYFDQFLLVWLFHAAALTSLSQFWIADSHARNATAGNETEEAAGMMSEPPLGDESDACK